jgi:Sec-independent protein translocase protein TatA
VQTPAQILGAELQPNRMLSVGPQELAVVGVLLLILIVFGSAKFSSTARNLGQILGGTKRTVDETKSDLIPKEVKEARDAIKDLKSEALYGAERDKQRRKP